MADKPQGYVRIDQPTLLSMTSADLAAYFEQEQADLADAIANGIEEQ